MTIESNHLFAGMLMFLSSLLGYSQAPEGYYSSLEGKSGAELQKAVKTIGKNGFHAISYGDATWNAFRSTDVRTVNGTQCWWDMYSDDNIAVSSGHPGMNIEHTVANSWWGGTKNDAYKDIVHLNPSNSTANSRKSNYPIGEISGKSHWDNGITFIGSPKSGQGGGCQWVYEPHDMYKGDFARVFMYMFVIYDNISWENATSTGDGRGRMYTYSGGAAQLQPWAYNLMLAWSAADPVSEKEINRNNGIYKEQGNRNPFIDLPDLADYIWGSKRNEVYHLDGEHNPVNPPVEPPTPPVNPPSNPDLEGKYILVDNSYDVVNGEKYIIVAASSKVGLSITMGSNGSSLVPTGEIEINGNVIENIPASTAIVTLEHTGSSYRLHLSDAEGNDRGHLASPKAKDLHIADSAEEEGTNAAISISGNIAKINYGSAGDLKYNASAKMWRTYASGQEDIQLYRFIPSSDTSEIERVPFSSLDIHIDGRSIFAPEGAMVFDLNGRRVTPENLEPGIYIVVSPRMEQRVKVLIPSY